MILIELKNYLKKNQRATLRDMAYHFEVSPGALEGMLGHWIRKGKVRSSTGCICNKGCCQTDPAYLKIYEWVESKPIKIFSLIEFSS